VRGYLRIVREVAHIPHPVMRIAIHSYNGQYRLQFEVDQYAQSSKFSESDHRLDEIQTWGQAMAEEVLMRFVDMRTQHHNILSSKSR